MSESESESLTPHEARELVEEIARQYGWFNKAIREETPPEVLIAIDNLRRGYGASARTLAQNLYKSQARFVFELIQNAEDNSYNRAHTDGEPPYVEFDISPQSIIVESNEDGFKSENVKAICKIDGSTKTRIGSQYYIGEKGIGFKSVFMVATNVWIQSGPFSFAFEHRKGDSGMGMLTPEYVPPKPLPAGVTTRITLKLLDGLDLQNLYMQFRVLPDTLLLFLNKLRRITISYPEDEYEGNDKDSGDKKLGKTIFTCLHDHKSHRATLFKSNSADIVATEYHVTRRQLTDLPRDDQKSHNTAEVVLAFPLDAHSVPIISHQHVFAYLPIQDYGFSSDFITQASREEVMETARNKALLVGVADTFVNAVIQLCQHPTLQYQWMRYLPQDIPDPYWRVVKRLIAERLKDKEILRPFSHGPLKRPGELKRVPGFFLGDDNIPLLPDLACKIYLAPEYDKDDLQILADIIGSPIFMSADEVYERFVHDLKNGGPKRLASYSHLKSLTKARAWHIQIDKCLLHLADVGFLSRMKTLQIIQLEDGTWTSIAHGAVYFHEIEGITIPKDIGLRLIYQPPFQDRTERLQLYRALGISQAPVQMVRMKIIERYQTPIHPVQLFASISHLHFLHGTQSIVCPVNKVYPCQNSKVFRNPLDETSNHENTSHNLLSSNKLLHYSQPALLSKKSPITSCQSTSSQKGFQEMSSKELGFHDYSAHPCDATEKAHQATYSRYLDAFHNMWIFDHLEARKFCDSSVYLQSSQKFSIGELLKDDLKSSSPPPQVSFINPSYMSAFPLLGINTKADFDTWLKEHFGLSVYPHIFDIRNNLEFTAEFSWIVRYRPNQVLGLLQANWAAYSSQITKKQKDALSEILVPCSGKLKMLRDSFLPTTEIKDRCTKFHPTGCFPFLDVSDLPRVKDLKFLKSLKAITSVDPIFYMCVLLSIRASMNTTGVCLLYDDMQKNFADQASKAEIVSIFQYTALLFTSRPSTTSSFSSWKTSSECVWEGPSYLTTKIPLKANLKGHVTHGLEKFFIEMLEIPNVTPQLLIDELRVLKSQKHYGFNTVTVTSDIYSRLGQMLSMKPGGLQSQFEHNKLIFYPLDYTWRSPSEFLWSQTSSIQGKSGIKSHYKELKQFFVNYLGVVIPDMRMLVKELVSLAQSSTTTLLSTPWEADRSNLYKIKSIIWEINDLKPTALDLWSLRNLTIIPVRLGFDPRELYSSKTPFLINDRQPLVEPFKENLRMLDFSVEEVRKLGSFLSAMQVEQFYATRSVLETTLNSDNMSDIVDASLTFHMRHRAYYIQRCATHFNLSKTMDDDEKLYKMLQNVTVAKSSTLKRQLRHKPSGEVTRSLEGSVHLEINDDDELRKIWVPMDETKREICYSWSLPDALYKFCAGLDIKHPGITDGHDVRRILSSILACSDPALDSLLEEAGIGQLKYSPARSGDDVTSDPGARNVDKSGNPDKQDSDVNTCIVRYFSNMKV